MKRRTNRKIIVGLLVFVVAMSVGYAVFGQTLTINGTGSLDYNWDVHFDDKYTEGGLTGQTAPTMTDDTITFNVVFTEPGQSKEYTFTVENEGTIDAYLKSTTLTPGTSNVDGITFKYEVTGVIAETDSSVATVATNTLANTTGTQTVKVTMSYDADETNDSEATSATFALKLNYEQK